MPGASSVTGVDLSPGMITQAEKKFRQPEIHLIRADILACRFDHPFDRCLVLNTLPHFTNPDPLLRRLAGCVRPAAGLPWGNAWGKARSYAGHVPASLPCRKPPGWHG